MPIDRTTRLNELMEQYRLTPAQVGGMLTRSAQTVRCWRCQWEARTIPEHTLAVLEMKLAAQAVGA